MPVFLRREQHLLTAGIFYLLDDRYASLPRPSRILQLWVTNLRNRPLSVPSILSLKLTILSLYHNLVTESTDFPIILYRGHFRSLKLISPFGTVGSEQLENSLLPEQPSGLVLPPADSGLPPPNLLTPMLPEAADLGAVRADRRNRILFFEYDGTTVTRVISPVFRADQTLLRNRWRVTDYLPDGRLLMSVLCKFERQSTRCAPKKRPRSEDEDSSSVSTQKRLRV